MKFFNNINVYLLWLVAFGTVIFSSCTDDETSLPYMNVEKGELYATKKGYGYNGSNLQLEIKSNTYWVINRDEAPDWITLGVHGGSGDGSVEIFVSENTGDSRSATFYIETQYQLRDQFTVYQTGSEEVLTYITQDFGPGSSKLPVAQYEEWNRSGVGGERVIFTGRNSYVDSSNPSSVYDDVSGGGNLLLTGISDDYDPDAEELPSSYFQMENIVIKSDRNFTLFFGSTTEASAFDTDALVLYLSKDNVHWTPVEYSRSTASRWEQTRLDFWLQAQNDQIYIRFVNYSTDNYRIDDFRIIEGNGSGVEIEFEEDVETIHEYLILYEDFSWIEGGSIADGNGMGSDGGNISGNPNGMQNGWTANPTYVYRRPGHPKLGATGVMGGMVSPPLEKLKNKTRSIKVEFDVAIPYSGDYTTIHVEAMKAGTIEGQPSVVLDVEDSRVWKRMSVTIDGATSGTQIQFRSAISNEVMVATGRNNRILLDNIEVTYQEVANDWEEPDFWTDTETVELPREVGTSLVGFNGNKAWTAQVTQGGSWLSVDNPSGEGGTSVLEVTADSNNTGAEREGEITIMAVGLPVLTLPVLQSAGNVVGIPVNIVLLEAATTNVSVMWEAPEGNDEAFNFNIAKKGGPILEQNSVPTGTWKGKKHPLTAFTFPALEPSTDYVIGIQTISSQAGFGNSDWTYFEVRTADVPVFAVEPILYNPFDGCDWGGNHMLRTYGYKPTGLGNNSLPTDARTVRSDPNAGGSSNMMATAMNDNYKSSRGISGWVGTRVYENPGFIKFGANGETGDLTTAPLSNIQGTANIRVQFRVGSWNEPNENDPYNITCDTFRLKVEPDGPGQVVSSVDITVTQPYTWQTFHVDIDGADATTKIHIATEKVTGGTSSARCCFDDLLITYRD